MTSTAFKHRALKLNKDKLLIYTAMSKHLFYFRMHVSKYVLKLHKVPLNPFMIFEYFLADLINHDLVREGNNNLVKRCDEVWVFGDVSNGVLAEIKLAKKLGKPLKYFRITNPHRIVSIKPGQVKMEKEVEKYKKIVMEEFVKS